MNIVKVVLLLSFFALPGIAAAKYSGGSGDANDPYQIGTAGDLLVLAADLNDYNKHFILTADINLADAGAFATAIIAPDTNNANQSFDGTVFTGVFDGHGHTISNLKIDTNGVKGDYLGLFGFAYYSEIKNLRLKDVNIAGDDNSVCLGGLAGLNEGDINNCSSSGQISGGKKSYYVGGLAGYNANDSNIRNCYSTDNITGDVNSHFLGGLAGYNIGNISGCYSVSQVSGREDSSRLGGLAGYNDGNISNCHSNSTVASDDNSVCLGGLVGLNEGDINNCYSKGQTSGGANSGYLGGLAGYNDSNISSCYSIGQTSSGDNSAFLGGLAGYNSGGNITNCFSRGTVASGIWTYESGGLVGRNDSGTISNCYSTTAIIGGKKLVTIGGLVGYNKSGNIYNCYSAGAVRGTYYLGGLVGACSDINFINCYFLSGSGPANGIGKPLSGTNMKKQSSFAGWDFNSVWYIRQGASFPKLHFSGCYWDGVGTAGDPYQIDTVSDLLTLAANTVDYNSCFILTSDINLASYSFTTAVIAPDTNDSEAGFQGTCFTGVFDGRGHKISNLTIDTNGAGNDYLGLFGFCMGGTMRNLGLEDVNITGGDNSVFLSGLAGMGSDSNITNCYLTGAVSGGNNSNHIGGLAGYNLGGSVSNCWSGGRTSGGNNSYYLGGLAGRSNFGIISNCYSTGTITGGGNPTYLGGLVGWNEGTIISKCWSSGNVTGGDGSGNLGGLAGENDDTVSNCYSTGDVNGGNNSSGLGGLAGYNYYGNITNCYSTGDVNSGSGSTDLGGLAGISDGNNISSCYFPDTEPNNNLGMPLPDAQMKQQASFTGWDFNSVWEVNEGAGYPEFLWQMVPIQVKKCSVTAGSSDNTDKISFSGTMYAQADNFQTGSVAQVTIYSGDGVAIYEQIFDINDKTFKKGKFNCTINNNPSKASFAFDIQKKVFSFSASNVSLKGLSCPLGIGIKVGVYADETGLDETIVNGPKAPIPIKLMNGVENTLRVDKCIVKQNSNINKDQLTASGGFAVANPDPNMANWITENLVITLGEQQFTINKGNLKASSGKFSCSNVKITDPCGTAAATFNFNLCSFALTIKDTNIPDDIHGGVKFGVAFADFNETGQVTIQ